MSNKETLFLTYKELNKINNPAPNAPTIAEVTKPTSLPTIWKDDIVLKATSKEAPELIPNTYGPASGFWNKVCIKSPDIDKAAPASRSEEHMSELQSRPHLVCRLLL